MGGRSRPRDWCQHWRGGPPHGTRWRCAPHVTRGCARGSSPRRAYHLNRRDVCARLWWRANRPRCDASHDTLQREPILAAKLAWTRRMQRERTLGSHLSSLIKFVGLGGDTTQRYLGLGRLVPSGPGRERLQLINQVLQEALHVVGARVQLDYLHVDGKQRIGEARFCITDLQVCGRNSHGIPRCTKTFQRTAWPQTKIGRPGSFGKRPYNGVVYVEPIAREHLVA
mmetsp:Transcript_39875/g.105771  ORF Transcript_39875/g.105771 Transcript_39875/m.105771 type:complete len:226 (-) Transcript_39875:2859-3536(-)